VDAGEQEAAGVLLADEAFLIIGQIRSGNTPVVVRAAAGPSSGRASAGLHVTGQGLRMVTGTSRYLIDQEDYGTT
jgi:hypothetical protein